MRDYLVWGMRGGWRIDRRITAKNKHDAWHDFFREIGVWPTGLRRIRRAA